MPWLLPSFSVDWKVVVSTTQTTHYGAPIPKMVSQLAWSEISANSDPATSNKVAYHDTLCCSTSTAATIWPCGLLPSGVRIVCNGTDSFASSKRWSPRRSHVALTIPGNSAATARIVVIGP